MRKEKANEERYFEEQYKNNCFIDVFYFINEKKKVVVCKLVPGAYYKYDGDLNFKDSLNKSFFEYCDDTNKSFVGKATCLGEDEFDIDFGMKLAYDKAMLKMMRSKRLCLLDSIDDIKKELYEAEELLNELDAQDRRVIERFENKIKQSMENN